jgi:predicted nucleotidyltransferase
MNDYLGKSMERVSEMAELFGAMTVSSVKALGGVLGNTGSALLSRSAAGGTLQSAGGVLNTLANFASTVISLLSPLGEVISAISNAALGLLVPLVGGVASVIDAWASIAGLVFKNVLGLLASVVDVIAPGLAFFGSAVQGLYTAISDIIILLAAKAKPYADKIVEWMWKLVDALVKAANWIATKTGQSSVIGEIQAQFKELHSKADNAREYLGVSKVDAVGGISGYIKKFYEEREQAEKDRKEELAKAEKNAAKLKRPSITQDFRGSKFSIEQNFATGFDPGRVLTAVREDAAALAQRRLTAGTTPLFGANI